MPPAPSTAESPAVPRRTRWRVPWGIGGARCLAGGVRRRGGASLRIALRRGRRVPALLDVAQRSARAPRRSSTSLEALPGLRTERSLRPLSALGTEPLRPANYDNGEKTFTCFDLGVGRARMAVSCSNPSPSNAWKPSCSAAAAWSSRSNRPPRRRASNDLSGARDDHEDHRIPALAVMVRPPGRLAEKSRTPDLILRWGIDFRRQ